MADGAGLSAWWIGGGSGLAGAVLSYFVPAFVSRKKDAGDLASDLLTQCVEDIRSLKLENAHCREETTGLRIICARNDLVLRLTLPELHRVSPYSSALQQARDVLGETFPVRLDTPPDMLAKLKEMDK